VVAPSLIENPTLSNPASVLEQVADVTNGLTTAAFVTVFEHTSSYGLLGIGTLKCLTATAATGTLTAVDPGLIPSGSTFVLNDGTNPAKTFEFTRGGPVGPGNVAVDISAAVTAADVKTAVLTAVSTAMGLGITAASGAGFVINLTNTTPGAAGNQTIITGSIPATGMSGGSSGASLNVRETVTDKFGVTDSVTATVASGSQYQLNLQTQFNTASPPYTDYKVEVEDTVPGTHASYSLHHASQGAA
jgi:hypothetical protein